TEDARLEVDRVEARFRHLALAGAAGLWDVHVLVGAPTERDGRTVAALLCAGAGTATASYQLVPAGPAGPLGVIARERRDGSPFRAPTELVAALARPPEREIPGVRLTTAPDFDVSCEPAGGGAPLEMGHVLDTFLRPAGPLGISTGALNRHAFVCGATGSGKSQTVRALLEALARAGVPWLVVEPAKAEYARMAGRLGPSGRVTVVRPGDAGAIPASINPLAPEPGYPLQSHVDLVRALFLAAFEADEPFPQVLSHALANCYTELGWDLVVGEPVVAGAAPRYPDLGDLQRAARQVVSAIGYGQEVTDNVRGFVDVRLGSLRLGTPGRFFAGGHPLDVAALLGGNAVIELEDVADDQDKAFCIGVVVIRLVEHLRVAQAGGRGHRRLGHVLVVEEAHRLLKKVEPGRPAAHAVELFASLLSEVRAYGEGVVVVEQIPAKLLPDVIKNTAVKIVHRLPAADDRDAVGATMNLTPEQSEYVVTLPPGRAAVFRDGMDRPVLAAMPLGEAREAGAE
ncbi:MAG: ATP-binding protein, partial [Acidimicrobiales bacterium]